MRCAADARGEKLKLSREESAFFDALAENESAVEALKDDGLAAIARKLGDTVRTKATIDWERKKSVQAQLRNAVRKILRQNGYPPDFEEAAVRLVLEQAERLKMNMVDGGSEAATIAEGDDLDSPLEAREELTIPDRCVRRPVRGPVRPRSARKNSARRIREGARVHGGARAVTAPRSQRWRPAGGGQEGHRQIRGQADLHGRLV